MRFGCGLLVLQLRKVVPEQVTGDTKWCSFPEDDGRVAECFILPGDINSGGQCARGSRYILAAYFDYSNNMLRLADV